MTSRVAPCAASVVILGLTLLLPLCHGQEQPLDVSSQWPKQIYRAEVALVAFTSPHCAYCTQVKQSLHELRASDWYHSASARVGVVDCARYPDLEQYYGVEAYPTLLLFRFGHKVEEYTGGWTVRELSRFLQRELRPLVTVVRSASQLQEFVAHSSLVEQQSVIFRASEWQVPLLEEWAESVAEDNELDQAFVIWGTNDTEHVDDCIVTPAVFLVQSQFPDALALCGVTRPQSTTASLATVQSLECLAHAPMHELGYTFPDSLKADTDADTELTYPHTLGKGAWSDLNVWLFRHSLPAFGPIDRVTTRRYLSVKRPLVFVYFPMPSEVARCDADVAQDNEDDTSVGLAPHASDPDYLSCVEARLTHLRGSYPSWLSAVQETIRQGKGRQSCGGVGPCAPLWGLVSAAEHPVADQRNTVSVEIVDYQRLKRYVWRPPTDSKHERARSSDDFVDVRGLQNALTAFVQGVESGRVAPEPDPWNWVLIRCVASGAGLLVSMLVARAAVAALWMQRVHAGHTHSHGAGHGHHGHGNSVSVWPSVNVLVGLMAVAAGYGWALYTVPDAWSSQSWIAAAVIIVAGSVLLEVWQQRTLSRSVAALLPAMPFLAQYLFASTTA